MILFTTVTMAQESAFSELKGKINGGAFNVDGVYVINLSTEKALITTSDGYFNIAGLAGDTLLFSAVQFKRRRIVLAAKDFSDALFFVKMEPIMNQLDEVVIRRYDNINSVSLGIISSGQKSYTAAERKLQTATGLNASASAGSMAGGSVSADPLFNFLSGRTAMLKKELKVEKKESYMRQLDAVFDRSHFVDKLKIPADYIKGFEYYAVDNEKFAKILESKNKITTEFLLGELALKYNEILACENE
ncbi:carboxypeptidase-like regulatory domain-containing protein [Flavobacterium sp. XN-5]|uniref:carboxypeptidase-like regulatory domain-containing protein n=1 Tax=Flavobacterium sp. XN-5 TaxID=2599390 RepID=UPI001FD7932B|nr:carboxypeptidase-like regulatory domain-containing protein [Flavobacterium sp. XN-5]